MKTLESLSLQELLETRNKIEALIDQRREEEKGAVLEKLQAMAREAGFVLDDLVGSKRGKVKRAKAADGRSSVLPKYKNPSNGETWTGRGKNPKWMQDYLSKGKKKEDFIIK